MNKPISSTSILIIQTAFLGDVILTTPLVSALQKGIPGCQIDFLTIPNSKNVVESNPNLRDIIIFDKRGKDRSWRGLRRLGKLLAGNGYSICVTPHRSWRSAYLTHRSGADIRIGFDHSAWSGVFTHLINYQNDRHEILRNLSLLGPLNIETERLVPELYPTMEDQKTVKSFMVEFLNEDQQSLFAIAPGSIWSTKRWPVENYSEVIKNLTGEGIRTVLIGGREDMDLCNEIAVRQDQCFSLAGKLSIRQTYQLLRSCQGLLTNDSAPLHLGMAASIPVFAVFGATIPEFGFAPFGKKAYIFENKKILCRPCGIHGGTKCPVRTFACMESIHPLFVAEKIKKIISNRR